MTELIFNLANLTAGLLLGASALDKLDGDTDIFNKIARYLAPFNALIGGTCLALGVLNIFSAGNTISELISMASGLLLLSASLSKIPAIGHFLVKISKALAPYKVITGIASLVIGLMGLFS